MSDRPPVTVRRATQADLDALCTLEQLFPSDRIERGSFARLIGRESAAVLVAEVAGEGVIGDAIVLYRRGFKSARLYSMVVAPQWRGHGVAASLLSASEEAALERGYAQMRLEVREDNAPAVNLYTSHAYGVVGHKRNYYQDQGAALMMRKTLNR